MLPDEAGIGQAPAIEANTASEPILPGWDQAIRTVAATTGPTPISSVSCPSAGSGAKASRLAPMGHTGNPSVIDQPSSLVKISRPAAPFVDEYLLDPASKNTPYCTDSAAHPLSSAS